MQGYIKDNKSSQVTIRTDTLPPISQGRKANAANLFDENPDNLQDLSDN